MWAGVAPVATAERPAPRPTRSDLHRWIQQCLDAGVAASEIVARGTNTLGRRSKATMWRELAKVRAGVR
jgi:hypothetical protein